MSKILVGLAFLLVADPSMQENPPLKDTPPLYSPPSYNPTVNDPEVWKDDDFFSADEDNKAIQQQQSTDTLPPDGDRAWRRKDYLTAATDYQKQAVLSSDAPEPWYDAALSYYRQKGWRAETLNALTKAEAHATGSLRARCLLMRADLEYRDALPKEPFARIEGLGRALQGYRDVLADPETDPRIAKVAKYDIEVVKLRLLLSPRTAGSPPADADSDIDPSADDVAAAAPAAKQPPKAQDKAAQAKDW